MLAWIAIAGLVQLRVSESIMGTYRLSVGVLVNSDEINPAITPTHPRSNSGFWSYLHAPPDSTNTC